MDTTNVTHTRPTRQLFAAGIIPARSSQLLHESDVMYVPLRDRAWDADSETFQPRRSAPECDA